MSWLVAVLLAVTSACSGTTPAESHLGTSAPHGLRAAALAWEAAYLSGTPDDIANLQGPECAINTPRTPANERIAATQLQQMRQALQGRVGHAITAIKIRGVLTRNVTATSGEAEVEYNLPESATGNDNWVTYELHHGQWKVADCIAPIGGSSSSKSFAATTTRPR